MDESVDVPSGAVVVGVDGSERDETVLGVAADCALRRGRPLHVVHARERMVGLPAIGGAPIMPDDLDDSEAVLAAASDALRGWDLQATFERPVGGSDGILVARSQRADLVVVGTGRKSGIAAAVLGATSLSVAAHAACPVLVVPGPPPEPSGRVVVGVDGSDRSVEAVREAVAEATSRGATLVVVTTWDLVVVDGYVVTEPDSSEWRAHEAEIRAAQEAIVEEVGTGALRVEHVVTKDRATRGLLAAAEGADLLVVASRGRGGFRGKLLGSVTVGLLKQAELPVLVTHQRD